MPGYSLDARASNSPAPVPSQPAELRHVPATSRTRRVHGVFNLGTDLAVVYSARRAGDGQAVTLEVGDSLQRLTGTMTAAQARAMARALVVAAEASEGAQRRPPVERRSSPASVPSYSALAPNGERVLLPVGTYFDRSGKLQGGGQ